MSGDHYRPKPDRNKAIADAYRSGTLLREIAAEYGLSLSRVSYIVKQQGAQLSYDDRIKRCSEHSARIARDPVVRAKVRAAVKARWASGQRIGRQAIFGDDPAKRDEYLTLRECYGAAYARRAMGLAA